MPINKDFLICVYITTGTWNIGGMTIGRECSVKTLLHHKSYRDFTGTEPGHVA
jgi:hypothetical protein